MKRTVWAWTGRMTSVATCAFLIAGSAYIAFADRSPDALRITSFWPFTVIERLSQNRTYTHVLPPLFSRNRRPESDRRTLRPLFTAATEYKPYSEQEVTVDFLPPLGRASRTEDEKTFRFFPLIHRSEWKSADGTPHTFSAFYPLYHRRTDGSEWHTAVFPFYMAGTSGAVSYPIPFKSTRDYHAIFPIYGNLYGAFGNDRVSFTLWPLYTRIEKTYKDTEGRSAAEPFVKHQVLWPIFTYGSGGGYESIKVWPIYGQTVKEGQYVSRFFLWPIFNYTKNLNPDPNRARDVVAGLPVYWDIHEGKQHAQSLFPFYGKRSTPDFERSFRLWPLYINTKYIKEAYTTRDYLWPVFSRTDGAKKGFKVWPLFGVRRQREVAVSGAESDDVSAFYLWTLGKYERNTRRDSNRIYNRLFPLYVYGRYEDEAGYKQRQMFLWPILAFQEDSLQDAKAVSFPNLLGSFEAQFPMIQEVYSPLWRVVDYARQGEEERLSVLWNMVSLRRDRNNMAVAVGPFFNFNRSDTGLREYTLLSSVRLRARPADRSLSLQRQVRGDNTPDSVTALRARVSAAWESGMAWVRSVSDRLKH